MTYLLILCSGFLGGIVGGWVRQTMMDKRLYKRIMSEIDGATFEITNVEPDTLMVIPWDVKTATVTSGWSKLPNA